MMRVLVVDDDAETLAYIVRGMRELGHTVESAPDGNAGAHLAMSGGFDVIVLDRLLPGIDGLEILKRMRASQVATPVLLLSAIDGVEERVAGLNAGSDDYLTKPFSFIELAARTHALGRRPPAVNAENLLTYADLEMDIARRVVKRAGRTIDLQPREFRLLEYLLRNATFVVTRTMLLERVWDFQFDPTTKVIETHISRLRTKIDKDFDPPLIQTVRSAGYSLRAPD